MSAPLLVELLVVLLAVAEALRRRASILAARGRTYAPRHAHRRSSDATRN